MNRKFLFKIILSSLVLIVFCPALVSADDAIPGALKRLTDIGTKAGYKAAGQDNAFLAATINKIVKAFLSLLGVIFIFLIILAGYDYMTARGEEQKVEKALATIRRAIIGLIIILASFAIWKFIFDYLISGQSQ
jgi:hypothetical protein